VQIARLETEIDMMNADLEPLNSFILPGGSDVSAWLHLARTVARRAERQMTELASEEVVNEAAMQYINRLSDHLFVLARNLNENGKTDVWWRPGENSGQK
jgi:cob(I)alamin adenosyltransferase